MEAKMAQAKANRTLVFFRGGATPSGRPSEAALFVGFLCCSAIVTFGGSRSLTVHTLHLDQATARQWCTKVLHVPIASSEQNKL